MAFSMFQMASDLMNYKDCELLKLCKKLQLKLTNQYCKGCDTA